MERTIVLVEGIAWIVHDYCLGKIYSQITHIPKYQMLGRAFVTNPTEWKGCHTYPIFKELNPDGTVQLLPITDTRFTRGIRNELAFAAGVTIPSIIFFIIIGLVWSCIAGRKSQAKMDSERELK
jgi:arginine exporter protein ArgO